jgi:hypothetical protein
LEYEKVLNKTEKNVPVAQYVHYCAVTTLTLEADAVERIKLLESMFVPVKTI